MPAKPAGKVARGAFGATPCLNVLYHILCFIVLYYILCLIVLYHIRK